MYHAIPEGGGLCINIHNVPKLRVFQRPLDSPPPYTTSTTDYKIPRPCEELLRLFRPTNLPNWQYSLRSVALAKVENQPGQPTPTSINPAPNFCCISFSFHKCSSPPAHPARPSPARSSRQSHRGYRVPCTCPAARGNTWSFLGQSLHHPRCSGRWSP